MTRVIVSAMILCVAVLVAGGPPAHASHPVGEQGVTELEPQQVGAYVRSGPFRLRFAHSGKCIDNRSNSAEGSLLVQWTCANANNQKFYKETNPNGTFRLRNVRSNLCLAAYSSVNNAAVVQVGCYNDPYTTQVFYHNAGGRVVSYVYNNCMHQYGGVSTNGGRVTMWHCTATSSNLNIQFIS